MGLGDHIASKLQFTIGFWLLRSILPAGDGVACFIATEQAELF